MSTLSTQSATLANVSTSTTSATLLAAGGGRKGFLIFNDSAAVLTVAFSSSAASATNATYAIAAGATWEPQSTSIYGGPIQGILASSTGTARVTSW